MIALLLALVLDLPLPIETEVRVDLIEVNSWTVCNSTQTQLIYWRWNRAERRPVVVGWRIAKPDEVTEHQCGYLATHRNLRIVAPELRRTSTTFDREVREGNQFGRDYRVPELCGAF